MWNILTDATRDDGCLDVVGGVEEEEYGLQKLLPMEMGFAMMVGRVHSMVNNTTIEKNDKNFKTKF